jgi:hypothetical protein
MRDPIAETISSMTLYSGKLTINLSVLDYGTSQEYLACFPGAEIDNLVFPGALAGTWDAAALVAITRACAQSPAARDEVMSLCMWNEDPFEPVISAEPNR